MTTDITASQAFDILSSSPQSFLIDTRSREEWRKNGYPLFENKVLLISSHLMPDMLANPQFLRLLQEKCKNMDASMIFMCRSSTRSRIAADIAEAAGYKNCFVVSDGFAGSQFGPGWKNSNLPIAEKL
ncbi:MAG: rhodanese-like domain-containing protein [Rickettsiaceae bacterium]|nr:rhodanese-like domain-containing protein [Rickettsiaceae bacterium]